MSSSPNAPKPSIPETVAPAAAEEEEEEDDDPPSTSLADDLRFIDRVSMSRRRSASKPVSDVVGSAAADVQVSQQALAALTRHISWERVTGLRLGFNEHLKHEKVGLCSALDAIGAMDVALETIAGKKLSNRKSCHILFQFPINESISESKLHRSPRALVP
jgi:hypothetical protein